MSFLFLWVARPKLADQGPNVADVVSEGNATESLDKD